ncbi:hypothetical protein AB3X94_20515 [Paraburkholderia sp. BR10923]|uniref:hypothetical protein n=1 Tax=Paraburkholderia sp. BR10923 TaxID=3236992 RepID=UPI0034CFB34A
MLAARFFNLGIGLAFFITNPSNVLASVRTTEVVIENRTSVPITGESITVNHGEITTRPPRVIQPGQSGRLIAESNGFMTGTEGTVRYKISGVAGAAAFHWDDPFSGSNSFDGSAPGGYVVDHTVGHANHTVVFFFVREAAKAATVCNGEWVVSHLGRQPEPRLHTADETVAIGSTPLKKMGIQGWVDTGCVASAIGVAVREAQHSTDGFWTIDLRLSKFNAGGAGYVGSDPPRYVRIEVEPDTPAHAYARVRAGQQIAVRGRVFIDTHHGEQLIEIHPHDPMTAVAGAPR